MWHVFDGAILFCFERSLKNNQIVILVILITVAKFVIVCETWCKLDNGKLVTWYKFSLHFRYFLLTTQRYKLKISHSQVSFLSIYSK